MICYSMFEFQTIKAQTHPKYFVSIMFDCVLCLIIIMNCACILYIAFSLPLLSTLTVCLFLLFFRWIHQFFAESSNVRPHSHNKSWLYLYFSSSKHFNAHSPEPESHVCFYYLEISTKSMRCVYVSHTRIVLASTLNRKKKKKKSEFKLVTSVDTFGNGFFVILHIQYTILAPHS